MYNKPHAFFKKKISKIGNTSQINQESKNNNNNQNQE